MGYSPSDVIERVNLRYSLLDILYERTMSKAELTRDVEMSRSSVSRGISELQEIGLVRHERTGEWSLSKMGKIVYQRQKQYIELISTLVDHQELLEDSALNEIPVEFLQGAQVEATEHRVLDSSFRYIDESLSEVNRLSALCNRATIYQIQSILNYPHEHDLSIRLIATSGLLQDVLHLNAEVVEAILAAPDVDVYRSDKTPDFGIWVLDHDRGGIVIVEIDGKGGSVTMFRNDAVIAHAWGGRYIENTIEKAAYIENIDELRA